MPPIGATLALWKNGARKHGGTSDRAKPRSKREKGVLMIGKKGFTLIELMIVVSIISILMTIAVPNFLRFRMNANDGAAVGHMRTISTSETMFQSSGIADKSGDGVWDYATLEELGSDDNGPPFIDEHLSQGARSGYLYEVEVTESSPTSAPAYTCIATPARPGRSGIRSFFVDETGTLRYTVDGSTPGPDSNPID